MKYKVGDKILVEAEVIETDRRDEEFPIRVVYESGSTSWVLPELLHELPHELPKQDKTYEDGLQDAWELAKKIAMEKSNGGFDSYEIVKIFGFNDMDAIFMSYTPQEALAKLKEYEEQKELKMGDVVIASCNKLKITGMYYGETKLEYWILDPSCKTPQALSKDWKLEKTAKHIDIAGLLEQIKGE